MIVKRGLRLDQEEPAGMKSSTPHGKPRSRTPKRALAGSIAMLLVLTSCGDGGDAATTSTAAATSTTDSSAQLEVTAIDFAFTGLPERVAAGTTLTLVNDSSVELHELVAIRLPDDESRSVEELIANPEALAAYFPSVTTVLIAPPDAAGIAVEGTGQLTEPGRYAIICAIPTGADPAEYMEAAAEAEGGPPDVAGGAPHFVAGMYADLVVE
jgi:plastocyanin